MLRSLILTTLCALGLVTAEGPAEVPGAAGPGHPMACTDYTQGKVFVISAEGRIEWDYPARNANDIWVLPNGNLLFNTGHGVKEVTRTREVEWSMRYSLLTLSRAYFCGAAPLSMVTVMRSSAAPFSCTLTLTPSGRVPAGVMGTTVGHPARSLPSSSV